MTTAAKERVLKVHRARFTEYGSSFSSQSLESIVALARDPQVDLWANAEDSGCESSYVEVARWSNKRNRWELFAFCKMLDVTISDEDGSEVEMSDDDRARYVAGLINTHLVPIAKDFPRWEG